jgi:hypothetical protein
VVEKLHTLDRPNRTQIAFKRTAGP